MDVNWVRIDLLFNTLSTGIVGFILNIAEPYLPVFISRTFRYGKYAAKAENSFAARAEVPKRWFKHFYLFAAPVSSCVLLLVLYRYVGNYTIPQFVYQILDTMFGTKRRPLVSPAHTILATVLLTIQCWKRLYETHCVSVFSNGKINFSHYIIGFVHYIGAISCMIGEAQGFVKGSSALLNWNKLSYLDYLCAIVFLWASYQQLKINFILAKLRKNKRGVVVNTQYKIPKDGLFLYISSPLQLTEVLMYFMLTLILWDSATHHYVFLWVLVNQVETGLLNHWWYIETFKDYPPQRKAFIPYIM